MEQLAIALTGCVAIWLTNDRRDTYRRWAPIFGLLGQPFWMYAAYTADQWGIFAMTFIYTFSWMMGFYNYWIRVKLG